MAQYINWLSFLLSTQNWRSYSITRWILYVELIQLIQYSFNHAMYSLLTSSRQQIRPAKYIYIHSCPVGDSHFTCSSNIELIIFCAIIFKWTCIFAESEMFLVTFTLHTQNMFSYYMKSIDMNILFFITHIYWWQCTAVCGYLTLTGI